MNFNKILVLGAGQMGNGIAHVFAQTGYNVVLADISEKSIENGYNTISKNLNRILAKGKITQEEVANDMNKSKPLKLLFTNLYYA